MACKCGKEQIFIQIVAFFCFSSVGFFVGGCPNPAWIFYPIVGGPPFVEGLWVKIQGGPTGPQTPIEALPWINAVRSFQIIGGVFSFIGAVCLVSFTGCLPQFKKHLKYASYCSCTGAWSFLISMAVYTASVQNGYLGSGGLAAEAPKYIVGFILAWCSAACAMIGSTLFWMNLKRLEA